MHNLISYNQLASWKQLKDTIEDFVEQNEIINDYYQCNLKYISPVHKLSPPS